jgi:O-antigen/teichoic acid export membrane protein
MLKQRFLVQFGSTAITHVIGMLAGIVVARTAGPGVVGTLAYGAAFAGILSFTNGLFGTPHIKLVSEGRDHSQCMAVFARLQGASVSLYLIATLGWFLAQKYLLGYKFESTSIQIVIVLAILTHFLSEYAQYANVVYTANLKQAKANLPSFIRTLLWHMGRIVIVLLGFRAVGLSYWNLLLAVLLVPFLYRMLKDYPLGKYDPRLAREYFRYAIPVLIIVVVNSITGHAGKLFLAHYTNTTQLGYFSAANSIGGMFMLIAMPVGQIFFPLFSGMIAKGNWAGVNTNIRKYQEFIVLFAFPLICALAVAGGPLLLLVLGERYQPSVVPFIILMFATYFVLWGLPYGNILSGMGKFYLSAWINGIKLIVFAISITVFVSPNFLNLGATGVALNLLVLNLTVNALYLLFARRHGEVHLDLKNMLRHLIIIVIAIGGFFLANYLKTRLDLWWLLYLPLFTLVTYFALISSRLIGREHWNLLLEAANLKKTLTYVNGEMRGK